MNKYFQGQQPNLNPRFQGNLQAVAAQQQYFQSLVPQSSQVNIAHNSQVLGNNQLHNNMSHFQLNKNVQPSSSNTNPYTQNPYHGQNFALKYPYVDLQVANQPGQLFYVY